MDVHLFWSAGNLMGQWQVSHEQLSSDALENSPEVQTSSDHGNE